MHKIKLNKVQNTLKNVSNRRIKSLENNFNVKAIYILQYTRMEMKSQKSIVLKGNMKNLMSILLPIAKKVISNQINK